MKRQPNIWNHTAAATTTIIQWRERRRSRKKNTTTNDKFSAMIHVLRMNECLQKQWLRYTSIRAPLLKCAPLTLSGLILYVCMCVSVRWIHVCTILMHIFVCNAHVLSSVDECGLLHEVMRLLFALFFWAFFECLLPLFLLVCTLLPTPSHTLSLSVCVLFFRLWRSLSPIYSWCMHHFWLCFNGTHHARQNLHIQTSFHFYICGFRIP